MLNYKIKNISTRCWEYPCVSKFIYVILQGILCKKVNYSLNIKKNIFGRNSL